jgi:hypothetical protein
MWTMLQLQQQQQQKLLLQDLTQMQQPQQQQQHFLQCGRCLRHVRCCVSSTAGSCRTFMGTWGRRLHWTLAAALGGRALSWH